MEQNQKPYFMLFNAVTDAVAAIEEQNFGRARQILIRAQQDCEEWFLSCPEDGDEHEACESRA